MIELNHISKSFGTSVIFDDFSYTFKDTGLYLLSGESGSGKTTLLNLLAGLTGFDSGEIVMDGRLFTDRMQPHDRIEYLTQDSIFVNFLTMEENLRLTGKDAEISHLRRLNCMIRMLTISESMEKLFLFHIKPFRNTEHSSKVK